MATTRKTNKHLFSKHFFFLCAKLPGSNCRVSLISAFALNCECPQPLPPLPSRKCSARSHEETSASPPPPSRSNHLLICKLLGEMRKMKSWLSYFCFRFVLFVFFLMISRFVLSSVIALGTITQPPELK